MKLYPSTDTSKSREYFSYINVLISFDLYIQTNLATNTATVQLHNTKYIYKLFNFNWITIIKCTNIGNIKVRYDFY